MKQKDKDELLELSRKALDSYIKKTYVKGDKPYKRAEGRKIAQKKEYDKAQSGKGWKEEVEQIDELSKETLKKYIPVADRQGLRARNSETINKQTGHGSDWDTKEYGKMADKREKGVKAALRKVYRKNQLGEDVLEEVEPLDELSKETLGSYINNAHHDATVAVADPEYYKRSRGHTADVLVKRMKGIKKATDKLTKEEVELSELDTKTYKSYSKLSSKEADKSINRFVKGGNEKELTHAEKRSKGINMAQTLMARKNMKIEEVDLDESHTLNKKYAQDYIDQTSGQYDGTSDFNDHASRVHHHISKKKGYDDDKFHHHLMKMSGVSKETSRLRKQYKKHQNTDERDMVRHGGKWGELIHKKDKNSRVHNKEETEMEYNEENGHIALVNAIFDGNRDEANEIFDTVLSGRINPVVSAKKEELAKTMFAPHEEVTEAYEPLPLTEEAEHGHHHRVHASLTDRKNDLSNEAHNGFMSGNLTKEHKKEVLKHVKAAEGRLDSAKAKLGSAESADHLNAAAVHITDGGLHLQNVRTYTSLGFRGY